ncbi:hypothetical protein [Archangium sp.]|nr:hypothetical protein [Archangium sp.]HYO55274.1 hypothetical protein [Archangium sp.]
MANTLVGILAGAVALLVVLGVRRVLARGKAQAWVRTRERTGLL